MNRGRALGLAVVVAVLVTAGLLSSSALATRRPTRETSLTTLNGQILAAVNTFRVAHGVAALSDSADLDRSARQHSLEMGRRGYFAHPSANGTAFWKRIAQYYTSKSYSHWAVGENLVWGSPTMSAVQAMKEWIGSPEHLRNLLSPKWRELGVSAVQVVRAPGVFHGRRVTIITTDFGVRG